MVDIGMVPTPVLYYATHALDQRAGVMLTGSHNPAEYNGLKMVLDGAALTEKAQLKKFLGASGGLLGVFIAGMIFLSFMSGRAG